MFAVSLEPYTKKNLECALVSSNPCVGVGTLQHILILQLGRVRTTKPLPNGFPLEISNGHAT